MPVGTAAPRIDVTPALTPARSPSRRHCTQDSQCGDRYQICSEHQGKDNGLFCTHKPLFPDFMTGDLLGTILGAVAAMIAAGGGIGGGGYVSSHGLVAAAG